MSSLDYLRGVKQIQMFDKGISMEFWIKSQRTKAHNCEKIKAIIDHRNRLIRSLHAYYKFSVDELVFMFRLSRSAIHSVIVDKKNWGDVKLCSVCQEIMYQKDLPQHIWNIKMYCSNKCKNRTKSFRRRSSKQNGNEVNQNP